MAERIYPRTVNGKTYYIYKEAGEKNSILRPQVKPEDQGRAAFEPKKFI